MLQSALQYCEFCDTLNVCSFLHQAEKGRESLKIGKVPEPAVRLHSPVLPQLALVSWKLLPV